MHRHEHGRALVALKGGEATIVKPTGQRAAHVWETGKGVLARCGPSGKIELHADVNEGTTPIEVMVVELKND